MRGRIGSRRVWNLRHRRSNPATRAARTGHGLSKLAAIIIMLSGLAFAGFALTFVIGEADYAELAVYVGIVIFLVAVVVLLGGFGILRGLELARAVGIIYSLLLSAVSFWLALGGNGPRVVAQGAEGSVFGSVFVLYAYSAIVLVARWRRPATA